MRDPIPAAALHILAAIRRIETGSTGSLAYDTIYGHNQKKLPKPLIRMTLAEVIKAGPSWTKQFKSSAAGAYQFMNATLKGLATEYSLDADIPFEPNFQDWLGYKLLLRRGYASFVNGNIGITTFGLNLAKEWASFPVLHAVKGAHRPLLKRGQSYYSGDALNKALVSAEEIEKILSEALAIHRNVPTPAPTPTPVPVADKKSWWEWLKEWRLFS